MLSSVAARDQPDRSVRRMADGPAARLGVAAGLFAARILAFRRDRAVIMEVRPTRLDRLRSHCPVARRRGPLAFGIFDRVIALPADFFDNYTPHERGLALEHELASPFGRPYRQLLRLCPPASSGSIRSPGRPPLPSVGSGVRCQVLDKAKARRADYGRAIAKIPSGRRCCLHRRSIDATPCTGGSSPCLPTPPPAGTWPGG